MAGLRFREVSHHFRFPAFSRNALQTLRRSKQDDPGSVPGAAVKAGCFADFLWRAARCFHSFQPASGDERDRAAVTGPERLRGPFGSGKTLRSDDADWADVEEPGILCCRTGYKSNRVTVG